VNYFAHARDLLDGGPPLELAGTALPDWLAACDRGARLRRPAVAEAPGALAAGVRRHLRDDRWFHGTAAFLEVSGVITRDLRRAHPDDPRMRAAFFGHVLAEMLLDAALIARAPRRLDRYYRALDAVDARALADGAAPWLSRETARLAPFLERFRAGRWLYGYADDQGLAQRVAGVARRVGLPAPPALARVLPAARSLVAERADDLLEPAP